MASNLTQITTAIENLQLNFTEINTSNLLTTAIQETNNNSNGWIGILIFGVMALSIIIYLMKHKQDFALFDEFTIFFTSLSIILDFGIFLIIWGILESYQIYIFLFCIFYSMAFFSLLKKDLFSPEQ
jgi:uncharacterized membrane protein